MRKFGCLAGDTRVYLPDEGVYRPIRDLEGKSGFRVLAIDDRRHTLQPRRVERAFTTGRKPVYRLTTRLGRTIRATGNHKFLAADGWRRLDDMGPGLAIAVPRQLPGPSGETLLDEQLALLGHLNGDRRVPTDVFAQSVGGIALFLRHLWAAAGTATAAGDGFVKPVRLESSSPELVRDLQSLLLRFGISAARVDSAAAHRLEITSCADLERYATRVGSLADELSTNGRAQEWVAVAQGAAYRAPIPADPWPSGAAAAPASSTATRELERPAPEILGAEAPNEVGAHDVLWDEIVSIEPDGEDDVYDLTVEELHSLVAEDIVVHNSLEQDADLVFFIYRDEYYNDETEAQGIAEVHLTKHRNGPTGTEKLAWLNRYAKFADLAAGG